MKEEKPPTIEELIEHYAEEYGADVDLVKAISWSESKYENVCNKEFGCISGIGPLQFVRSTFKKFCEGDVWDAEDNVRCGARLIAEKQTQHWKESVHLWWPRYKAMVLKKSAARLFGS